ncbi:MAG: hypothetical protein HS111_10080 [Kofleriaceae bacterium]|nr:hypothetical protein [Kofleriaceae bacterium]
MTVRDLIARLEKLNPSARVLLVVNRRWPWEHELAHVVERKGLEEDDRDEHWEADDVLLLEGNRIGFGPEHAWSQVGAAEDPRA